MEPLYDIDILEKSDKYIRFRVTENDELLSDEQLLERLSDREDFHTFYNRFLAESPFPAFFWECKPISLNQPDAIHECTLVSSITLDGVAAEQGAFREYFDQNKQVVAFDNLGGDARLVAPCPSGDYGKYAHIGRFVREAEAQQVSEFWKVTAQEMLQQSPNEPRWLSTSGLGVYWLHARIDRYPKYYQTESYKVFKG